MSILIGDLTLLNILSLSMLCICEATVFHSAASARVRRQLLFPNSTLLQPKIFLVTPTLQSNYQANKLNKVATHQPLMVNGDIYRVFRLLKLLQMFNAGIGVPTPANMVNFNWAFQANFQLPWNRTQIPTDLLVANSGYDGFSKKKRDVDTNGLAERDDDYESDARLYHFYRFVEEVLNSFGHNGTSCVLQTLCQLGAEPLHSDNEDDLLHEIASFILNPINDAVHHKMDGDESHPYIDAYTRGLKGQECAGAFDPCSTPLLDMFTKLHDMP